MRLMSNFFIAHAKFEAHEIFNSEDREKQDILTISIPVSCKNTPLMYQDSTINQPISMSFLLKMVTHHYTRY